MTYHSSFSAPARALRLGVADIDERGIGEPVDRHVLAAAGLAPAAAVGLVDALGGVEAGEERRLDVAVRADLRGAARARRADPDRRMRLLHRARPDVDRRGDGRSGPRG